MESLIDNQDNYYVSNFYLDYEPEKLLKVLLDACNSDLEQDEITYTLSDSYGWTFSPTSWILTVDSYNENNITEFSFIYTPVEPLWDKTISLIINDWLSWPIVYKIAVLAY